MTIKEIVLELKFMSLFSLPHNVDKDSAPESEKLEKTQDLYRAAHNIMIKELPKGKGSRSMRNEIYIQKSLFVNRGHRKTTPLHNTLNENINHILIFAEIVYLWTSEGSKPEELYKAFYAKNKQMGFIRPAKRFLPKLSIKHDRYMAGDISVKN